MPDTPATTYLAIFYPNRHPSHPTKPHFPNYCHIISTPLQSGTSFPPPLHPSFLPSTMGMDPILTRTTAMPQSPDVQTIPEQHPDRLVTRPKSFANAALLSGLPPLHYARFRYRDHHRQTQHDPQNLPAHEDVSRNEDDVPNPSVADRARLLAPAVGEPAAALFAARAMLAKLAPALLVSLCPSANSPHTHPQSTEHQENRSSASLAGHYASATSVDPPMPTAESGTGTSRPCPASTIPSLASPAPPVSTSCANPAVATIPPSASSKVPSALDDSSHEMLSKHDVNPPAPSLLSPAAYPTISSAMLPPPAKQNTAINVASFPVQQETSKSNIPACSNSPNQAVHISSQTDTQNQSNSSSQQANVAAGDLWLFSARAMGDSDDEENNDSRALLLVHDAFDIVEHGIWRGDRNSPQVPALLVALRDAMLASLEASTGGLRLGSLGVFAPLAGLLYKLTPSLSCGTDRSSGAPVDVLVRASIHRSNKLRPLMPTLTNPVCSGTFLLRVVIAPYAILADLTCPPRYAGDSLASNVLLRWEEAGLLPSGSSSEEDTEAAVVFVNLQSGVAFPVPRVCVLALDMDGSSKSSIPSSSTECNQLTRKRMSFDRDVTAKGNDLSQAGHLPPVLTSHMNRKRPRSPMCNMDEIEQAAERDFALAFAKKQAAVDAITGGKNEPCPSGANANKTLQVSFISRGIRKARRTGRLQNAPMETIKDFHAPTAISINRALGAVPSDPPSAVLHHPLSCYLEPPPELSVCSPIPIAAKTVENSFLEVEQQPSGATEPRKGDESRTRDSAAHAKINPPKRELQVQTGDKSDLDLQKVQDLVLTVPPADLSDFGISSPDVLSVVPLPSALHDSVDSGVGGFDMDELYNFDDDVTQFFAAAESSSVPPPCPSPVLAVAAISPMVKPSATNRPAPSLVPIDVDSAAQGAVSVAPSPTGPRSPTSTSAWLAGRLTMFDLPSPVERPASPEREEQLRGLLEAEVSARFRESRNGAVDSSWRNGTYSLNPRSEAIQNLPTREKRWKPRRPLSRSSRFAGNLRSVVSLVESTKLFPRRKDRTRDLYVPLRRLDAFERRVRLRTGSRESEQALSNRIANTENEEAYESESLHSEADIASGDDGHEEENKSSTCKSGENPLLESQPSMTLGSEAVTSEPPKASVLATSMSLLTQNVLTAPDIEHIARLVAVDCASACFVILHGIYRRNIFGSSFPNSGDRPGTGWRYDSKRQGMFHQHTELLQSANREHSNLSGTSPSLAVDVSAVPSNTLSHLSLGTGKNIANINLTGGTRHLMSHSQTIPVRSRDRESQREKDFAALYVLLQMQLIGSPDLQLFPYCQNEALRSCSHVGTEEHLERRKNESGLSKSSLVRLGEEVENDLLDCLELCPVDPFTLRRALFSLPSLMQDGSFMTESLFRNHDEHANVDENCRKASFECPLSIENSAHAALLPLHPPDVCVGFDGNWLESSSNILPLWEKCSLTPYSDVKNVQYAVLAPKELSDDVRCFVRDISAAYEESSLGKHAPVPFDPWTLIANSVSNPPIDQGLDRDVVTPAESRMIQQFQLAATGLAAKLTAVCKDARKSDAIGPNIVVYVVCPFLRRRRAAIAELLRILTPLVSCIPNVSVSSSSGAFVPTALLSTPWRVPVGAECGVTGSGHAAFASPNASSVGASTSNGGTFMGLTVRVLPSEIVERYPTEKMVYGQSCHKSRPLRPQLVKAVAFAVYANLRNKRISRVKKETEVSGASGSHEPSAEMFSPMTPDVFHVGSPPSSIPAPASPTPPSFADEYYTSSCGSLTFLEHGMSSGLYNPPYVLAGVGRHMGQCDGVSELVLHLAYTFSEPLSRFLYTWTDSRGETLDVGMVHVGTTPSVSRSRAFSRMWSRGQKWWVAYSESTCVTVAKVGNKMGANEQDDWENVVKGFVSSTNSRSDVQTERVVTKLRFPREKSCRDAEVLETAATPATPASLPTMTAVPCSAKAGIAGQHPSSMDLSAVTLRSVTVLAITESDLPELYAVEASEELAVVWNREGPCDAKASLVVGVAAEKGPLQIDLEMLMHFGHVGDSGDCMWDGADPVSILKHITTNFNALRYVSSPPCWPACQWRSSYPLHIETLLNMSTLTSVVLPALCR